MKQNKAVKKNKTKQMKYKRNKPRCSMRGIRSFLREVSRVSYTPRFACFCTPGHNRGAGF